MKLDIMGANSSGDYAVIAIHYNYIFDKEKDFSLREWEKLRYKHEIREAVYTIAHKLQGAVFSDDIVPLFIVTSKNMLNNVFLKQQDHLKLLQFGQQLRRFRVCLGIGLGDNMLEAKSRSTMALNRAFRDLEARAYIAETNNEPIAPILMPEHHEVYGLAAMAKNCGFTLATLQKLGAALEITGNPTTAEQLAQAMQMNIRSINRILTKLEDIGCVNTVAKKTNGRGRPARILKITLS